MKLLYNILGGLIKNPKGLLFIICSLFISHAVAQDATKTVSGTVIDAATGQPMAGVIVSAFNGQTMTAMTDEAGHYELQVPEQTNSVLMRVEGYNLQQTAIGSDGHADGRLFRDVFSPTYTKNPTAVTTRQAPANRELASNAQHLSADPLIASQLGSQVRTVGRSAITGMGNNMFIQGINSLWANAQPLVVIDDVIMDMQYNREMLHEGYYNNILANINVNDIESIEVLTNGTALYGAKGANGVLVIHTKRNKSMATKIDVNISGRYDMTPRLPEMMDASAYRLYTTELLNGHINPASMSKMKYLNSEPTYYYYNQYHNQTDWTDEVYHNAFSQNYGINVQGGDDAASYNLSVGYTLGKTTLRKNDYSRFNMRLNSDIVITDHLNVRFDASYSDVDRSLRDDGTPEDPLGNVITSPSFIALAKAPFLSPYAYDKNGRLSHYLAEADDYLEGMFQGRGRLANPSSILRYGDGKNRNSFGNRLIMFDITPKYTFNRNLSLQEHFTLGLINTNENYYLPISGVPTFIVDGLDEGTTLQNIEQSLTARQTAIQSDTRLNWNKKFRSSLLNVMFGLRFMSSEYKITSQKGYNGGNDKTPNMSSSLRFKSTGGADDKTRELTWYALANYSYADRYYLSGGISAHASSRFGEDASGLNAFGTVWGLFPSIEGAWVMSNEKWLADAKGINYLRLNVGFDVTGNDDIDYTASRSYFIAKRMLGERASGKVIGNIGNTDLQWESTRRFTAGLTGNFLDNRLSLQINVFKSWTSNLLALQQLAYTSGLSQNWSNEGKLQNEGFDFSINAKLLALKNFTWELGASAGHYKNKLTALPDNNTPILTNIYGATIISEVGQPVGLFYGYKTDGVYTTSNQAADDAHYILLQNGDRSYFQAGDMRFLDLSSESVVGGFPADRGLINEEDRTIIGDPNPDIYGNIFTKLTWKDFTLSATMTYSLGNDIYNYQRSMLECGSLFLNQTTAMEHHWRAEDQQTDIPRVSYTDPMGNSRFSDRWIEDGSYLRLADVTLSWHLPIQSTYLQGITIWGSAQNLFTLTHYLGSDPANASPFTSSLAQGIDTGLLPAGRSFAMGVNINL
ncbi:MAG: SusC/RagA family TonB-linked outer membrane protein [Prevotella sp.]|nr:SusC/RagA family TonB-linked outer membrane protein [Prevotella sp.]